MVFRSDKDPQWSVLWMRDVCPTSANRPLMEKALSSWILSDDNDMVLEWLCGSYPASWCYWGRLVVSPVPIHQGMPLTERVSFSIEFSPWACGDSRGSPQGRVGINREERIVWNFPTCSHQTPYSGVTSIPLKVSDGSRRDLGGWFRNWSAYVGYTLALLSLKRDTGKWWWNWYKSSSGTQWRGDGIGTSPSHQNTFSHLILEGLWQKIWEVLVWWVKCEL